MVEWIGRGSLSICIGCRSPASTSSPPHPRLPTATNQAHDKGAATAHCSMVWNRGSVDAACSDRFGAMFLPQGQAEFEAAVTGAAATRPELLWEK